MKLDLTHELRTLDGDVLKDSKEKPLTLRSIFIMALLDPEQSKPLTGEEKLERHTFAVEIKSAKRYFEFDINQSKLLKDLVGKIYTPLLVGQVWPILEKGHHSLTKKMDDDNGDNQDK